MQEPDFCEAQLQQVVNTEIFNLTRGRGPMPPMPVIITPYIEDLWGWDTGFFFPWMGAGHPKQRGCNFFIQYKLSNIYETPGAYGWDSWRQAFFRFNLGYRRNQTWNFAQRDHLINLADSGYTVVYITNHVLELSDLADLVSREQLCSTLPVLRVNNGFNRHERVSFASGSPHFHLHSEEEKYQRNTIKTAIEEINPSLLEKDVGIILDILKKYEEAAGIRENTNIGNTINQTLEKLKERNIPYAKAVVAWWFLWRYLNLYWFRFRER